MMQSFQTHRLRYLLVAASLILVGFLVAKHSFNHLNNIWDTLNRNIFLNDLSLLISLLSIGLFFILVYIAKLKQLGKLNSISQEQPAFRRGLIAWALGIILASTLMASVNIIVNPRGIYGTSFFIPWANHSRSIKTSSFLALPYTPDIVITGSSRAFSIQPAHIQESLGLSAFNFSLDSGKINDSLIQIRFMEAIDRMPEVLLIEFRDAFHSASLYSGTFSPSELLPYMPLQTMLTFLQVRLEGLLDIEQLSEALYSLQRYRFGPVRTFWEFEADGSGTFLPAPSLEESIDTFINRNELPCPANTERGREDAEALLQIAESHHTSVIFYLPPLPSRYYDSLVRDNATYAQCYQTFMDYINAFEEEYSQVYFLEFSDIDTVGGESTEAGFYDAIHMTSLNNNRMIDAAASTILEAYEQSQLAARALTETSAP